MDVKNGFGRIIALAMFCLGLVLTAIPPAFSLDAAAPSQVDPLLPVTAVDLSGKTPIVGITTWRICGPFVADDQDQKYSPEAEKEMVDKDYLQSAGASEVPLKLPSGITQVKINFERDPVLEPRTTTNAGVFLNQNQDFATPDVSSQILYWSQYHAFKIVYAAAEVQSPADRDVVLLASTSSPVKIWINDVVQTQSEPGSVGAEWDTHVGVRAHLRAGRNKILVKVICFPLRNDFGVWFSTLDGARQFIEEHGGVADVLTQVIASPGTSLRMTPIVDLFGGAPGREGRYEIRDVTGKVVATSKTASADTLIETSALPEGLYSIDLHKGELANGQLFFVGDLNHRLAMYSAQCASPSHGDLPCEALPKLTDLSGSAGATFRLEREKLIVFLMAQFEWSIHGLGLQTVIPDDTPRVRLISFRSKLDGTTQLYYLYASPDVQSGEPQPLVVVEPFNGNPKPFFESPPTTTNLALDRYARFADQYHLSYIAPFGRGKLLPSPFAEQDVLEAIEDAKQRIKVDNSRIYLTGECAAGRSALLMAEDYPEMFAAVSTLSAATHEYAAATNSVWDSANALLRLRNLSSMPIRLIHGNGDYHSPSPQASLLLQEAHKVGVYPEMMWLPGDSKFGVIEPQRAMFEFFATVKSRHPAVPSHVALAVTENAHNHEFWIQVDQRRLDNTPAYITGEISARNRIKITSSNVQKATIDLQKLPIDPSKKRTWTIVCNGGQKQHLQQDASKQIVLNIAAN